MNPMRALRQYQKVNSHAQISEASPHRLVQMLMEGGWIAWPRPRAHGAWRYRQKGLMLGKAIDIIIGLRDGLDAEKTDDPARCSNSMPVRLHDQSSDAGQHQQRSGNHRRSRALLITVKRAGMPSPRSRPMA
jgi:flagellar protein FliS